MFSQRTALLSVKLCVYSLPNLHGCAKLTSNYLPYSGLTYSTLQGHRVNGVCWRTLAREKSTTNTDRGENQTKWKNTEIDQKRLPEQGDVAGGCACVYRTGNQVCVLHAMPVKQNIWTELKLKKNSESIFHYSSKMSRLASSQFEVLSSTVTMHPTGSSLFNLHPPEK